MDNNESGERDTLPPAAESEIQYDPFPAPPKTGIAGLDAALTHITQVRDEISGVRTDLQNVQREMVALVRVVEEIVPKFSEELEAFKAYTKARFKELEARIDDTKAAE